VEDIVVVVVVICLNCVWEALNLVVWMVELCKGKWDRCGTK